MPAARCPHARGPRRPGGRTPSPVGAASAPTAGRRRPPRGRGRQHACEVRRARGQLGRVGAGAAHSRTLGLPGRGRLPPAAGRHARGAGRGASRVWSTPRAQAARLLCGPLRAAGPAPGSAEGGNVPYCLCRESGPRSLPARNSLSTGRPVYLHRVACFGAEKASNTTLVLKGLAVWWRAKPQPRWSTPRGVRQSPGHEARASGVADSGGGGGGQRVARDAPHRGGERARGLQGSLGATWLDAWAGFAFDTRSFE